MLAKVTPVHRQNYTKALTRSRDDHFSANGELKYTTTKYALLSLYSYLLIYLFLFKK